MMRIDYIEFNDEEITKNNKISVKIVILNTLYRKLKR